MKTRISNGLSIPSGTIKSFNCDLGDVTLYAISIPSGTIKRVASSSVVTMRLIFQFLLVRLKGSMKEVFLDTGSHFNSFWYD